jgi:hypothetical protein
MIALEVNGMSVMRCPHCGAENFTIESWEDLDHCSSCGRPLGEPEGDPVNARERGAATGQGEGVDPGQAGRDAERPRPA